MNSAPVTGALDAQTFRNVAKAQSPMVVNIRTETRQRSQELSDFFGGGGGGAPDDLLRRFFGRPGGPGGPGTLTPTKKTTAQDATIGAAASRPPWPQARASSSARTA